MHRHITKDDRTCIALLLRRNESYAEIAEAIGVHRTTVMREIKRHGSTRYDARRAHLRSKERRKQSKVAYRLIDTDKDTQQLVRAGLEKRLSPEQITGKFKTVSFMTIYRYVARNPQLKIHLRRRGRKRRRYGTARVLSRYQANKRSIHIRPPVVGVGHWEGDTVVGKERMWSILTHVDKVSGYLLATRIRHLSDVVHERVRADMKHLPCESITYDNGSEFALHRMIEKDTGAMVYFADAGKPYQRGTNENTNGLLRDYFPKGTSFATITNKDVQRVVVAINNRPRKRLGYLTPREVFEREGVQFKC